MTCLYTLVCTEQKKNVKPKVFCDYDGTPEVLFVALREIKENEELLWNYGKDHQGLKSCVSSCQNCGNTDCISHVCCCFVHVVAENDLDQFLADVGKTINKMVFQPQVRLKKGVVACFVSHL